MSLDRLSVRVVEEGKEHPYVQALLRELKTRRGQYLEGMAGSAATGGNERGLLAYGARAWELGYVIELIEKTEGVET